MGVININILASSDYTIPGIPNSVSITTSEPATIFYTLDGTVPNTFSPIYIDSIQLPQSLLSVTLNVFATNGVDSSAIITTQYIGDKSAIDTDNNERLPRSAVLGIDNIPDNFPFSSLGGDSQTVIYENPAKASTIVFDPTLSATPLGFDGSGNPAAFTSLPPSSLNFSQIYSSGDFENNPIPGKNNLPNNVDVIGKQTPAAYAPESSSRASRLFNPRAMVIYQDATTDDPTNPPMINRGYFAMENPEIVKDGVLLQNTALDSPTVTGSFVSSFINEYDHTITNYYFDSSVNRWIISKSPFVQTNPNAGALYQMVFGRNSTKVFPWVPFQRRYLF